MTTRFGKPTVLIVDDEQTARETLSRFMNELGHATTVAADGQAALDLAATQNFDIVLMDVKMPGMNGLAALAKFQESYPNTIVIMATAVGEVGTGVEAMLLGAYDYIVKPLDLADVRARVDKAIVKRDAALREQEYRRNLEQRVAELVNREEANFAEVVRSLSREHAMLFLTSEATTVGGKRVITDLPPELQKPMSSASEFKEALLRILRKVQV